MAWRRKDLACSAVTSILGGPALLSSGWHPAPFCGSLPPELEPSTDFPTSYVSLAFGLLELGHSEEMPVRLSCISRSDLPCVPVNDLACLRRCAPQLEASHLSAWSQSRGGFRSCWSMPGHIVLDFPL